MKCPRCASALAASATECHACGWTGRGAAFLRAGRPAAADPPVLLVRDRPRGTRWVTLAAGLAVLSGGGWAVASVVREHGDQPLIALVPSWRETPPARPVPEPPVAGDLVLDEQLPPPSPAPTLAPRAELRPAPHQARIAPPDHRSAGGDVRPTAVPRAAPAPATVASPRRVAPAVPAPLPPARLYISSRPWGLLYLDGQLVGNTPKANFAVTPGLHRLRVVRDGFVPFERDLTVAPGQELRLVDIVLEGSSK